MINMLYTRMMRVSCALMLLELLHPVFAYLCSDGMGTMIARRLP